MEPRRRWTGGGGGSFTPATLGGDGRAGEHQWEVGKLSEGLIWVVKGRVRVLHGAGRPRGDGRLAWQRSGENGSGLLGLGASSGTREGDEAL